MSHNDMSHNEISYNEISYDDISYNTCNEELWTSSNDIAWDIYEQMGDRRKHEGHILYGYKAFNQNMMCDGFQFEEGVKYMVSKNENIETCTVFYFYRFPVDMLFCHPEENCKYALVKSEDLVVEYNAKCLTHEITIVELLTKEEVIRQMPKHITRISGAEEWYLDGQLHREDDQPAVIDKDTKYWCKYGILHREGDRPAIITKKAEAWFKDGRLHRDGDQPAFISRKTKVWCKEGRLYRDGQQHVIFSRGIRMWYIDGGLYCEGGQLSEVPSKFRKLFENGTLS